MTFSQRKKRGGIKQLVMLTFQHQFIIKSNGNDHAK